MPKIVARKAYDEYVDGYVSPGVLDIDPDAECFVQQSDLDRSDINRIVERFVRTGILESVKQTKGEYGDFSEITDYHDALIRVEMAEDAFMTLPATVRKRFDNDPGQFLDFLNDPANELEAYEMGLFAEGYTPKGVSSQSASSAAEAPTEGG